MDKVPNKQLIRQRELRGWSQEKLAGVVGTTAKIVGRWERGESKPTPLYRMRLIKLFAMDAEKLGFLEKELSPNVVSSPLASEQCETLPSLPSPEQDIIGEEEKREKQDMDRKRRELLRFLSVASGILISPLTMPELDWDRIEKSVTGLSTLDSSVLDDFAAINSRYWSLYLATSSKASVLHGVIGQIETLLLFLREPLGSSKHQLLCMLSSELGQLAGEIYFDMHDYESAQACYVFAASAAKEAGAYDLWACSLVRHAFLPLYEASFSQRVDYYRDALSLLHAAHRLTEQGDSSLPTKYWVAAVEAEAISGVHDLASCQRALDQAQGVLEIKTQNPLWIRFNGTRLPALQGACYVRLQQPGLAIPVLHDALRQFPKPDRKRDLAIVDLAAALLLSQQVEQACVYIQEAIDIAACSSSTFLRQHMQELWIRLDPFADNVAVKELEYRIKGLSQ